MRRLRTFLTRPATMYRAAIALLLAGILCGSEAMGGLGGLAWAAGFLLWCAEYKAPKRQSTLNPETQRWRNN